MWMFDIWYETVEQVMKCMMRDNQYRTGDHRSEESKGHPPLLPLIVFRRRWTLQGHASHDLSADTIPLQTATASREKLLGYKVRSRGTSVAVTKSATVLRWSWLWSGHWPHCNGYLLAESRQRKAVSQIIWMDVLLVNLHSKNDNCTLPWQSVC